MRRIIPLVIAVVLVAVVSSAGAGTGIDRHFTVISKDTSSRETDEGFTFKANLLNPFDLSDKVGHASGGCKFREEARKIRCRGLFHLNGEIGGSGDLVVRGNLGRGDNSLLVVNGTGEFNGVVGKMKVGNAPGNTTDKDHFDLVR